MSDFNIRNVVKEFLQEKVEVEELPENMLSAASVDTQIDDFLIDAEKKANQVAKKEDEISLERVDRLIGLEKLNEEENSEDEPEVPSIDISTFAADVARLSKNYDNLLEILGNFSHFCQIDFRCHFDVLSKSSPPQLHAGDIIFNQDRNR